MARRHQPVFAPAAVGKAVQYMQAATLLERIPQRAIVCLTGISLSTIVKLAKKASATPQL